MISNIANIINDHVKANQLSALFRFGITLLIGIILVRSGYTDEQVGHFEYAVLMAYSFSFFIGFAYSSGILSRMPKLISSQWSENWDHVFVQLVSIGFITGLVSFISLALLVSFNVIELSFNEILPISIFIFFLISTVIPENYFLLYKNGKALSLYTLTTYFLQLTLVSTFAFLQLHITLILWVYIFIQGIKFIWTLVLLKPNFSFNLKHQKTWFLFSLPLMLHFLLGSGMDYIDGHLVAGFFSEEKFLYYRYGARELPLSLLMVNAVSAAMIPLLSENIKNISELKIRLNRLMHILFPVAIVFLFIGPYLFTLFYGDNFELSGLIFNIYLLINISRLLNPQILMYANQDNNALVIFSAIELVVNIALSLILLRYFGVAGVAIATVFAYLFNKILSIIYCRRKYKIKLSEYINIPLYISYTLGLFVAFYFSYILIFSNGEF